MSAEQTNTWPKLRCCGTTEEGVWEVPTEEVLSCTDGKDPASQGGGAQQAEGTEGAKAQRPV